MQKIYNWLYEWLMPAFLRRWDIFLLERYPVVWRTQVHYVLFHALMAAVALFISGFFTTVSAAHPTIDPIKPIILGDTSLYIFPLVIVSFGILYWSYIQFLSGFPSTKPKHVLFTLIIYAFCLWIIIAVTASAFSLGSIMRTANFLIDDADIKYWEKNDYFLYGFVFKQADTTYSQPDRVFFQEREDQFKRRWNTEEAILNNRYNISFMDSLIASDNLDTLSWKTNAYLSDYRFPYSPKLYLQHIYRSPNSLYLLNWDGWPIRSYWSSAYRRSEIDAYYKDSTSLYHLYNIYRLEKYKISLNSYNLDNLDRYFMSNYKSYYDRYRRPQIDTTMLLKNAISLHSDSIIIDSFIFIRPAYLHEMENAIRSVKHARQYLKEEIIFRHFHTLLLYVPLLALLLFSMSYLSFRNALIAVATAVYGTMVITVTHLEKIGEYYLNAGAYLTIPLIGFLLLIFAALHKKREKFVSFAFHLLAVGMASILFFALFGEKWVFTTDEIFMGKPVDLAFFGVQVIGLVGVLLMTYLQALPKRA